MNTEDRNVFAGAFVDRSGERRKDPAWLAEALASPAARFVPVWREQCLVNAAGNGTVLLARDDLGGAARLEESTFLGLFRNRPVFAVAIVGEDDDDEAAIEAAFAAHGTFRELRYLGSVLPADEANLVAHARAMVIWHAAQVHCGRCGAPSRPEAGGNARLCTAEGCGQIMFPRVDPAIIVLVAQGDRCLLGRQPSWPEDLYSTIAGFVEPGESLEDAVRREVFEETNIRVGPVEYHSSQPWPFPSSLMIGFQARAVSGEIALNDGELEDARWFTRDELLADGPPALPFGISISRRLIDHWLAGPRVADRPRPPGLP